MWFHFQRARVRVCKIHCYFKSLPLLPKASCFSHKLTKWIVCNCLPHFGRTKQVCVVTESSFFTSWTVDPEVAYLGHGGPRQHGVWGGGGGGRRDLLHTLSMWWELQSHWAWPGGRGGRGLLLNVHTQHTNSVPAGREEWRRGREGVREEDASRMKRGDYCFVAAVALPQKWREHNLKGQK